MQILNADGSEDRTAPKNRTKDESVPENRFKVGKAQRQIIAASGLFLTIAPPKHFDAKGTEHTVRFRGRHVEKQQHSDGWSVYLDGTGHLAIHPALATEYLWRLDCQNELFGDNIQVIGITLASMTGDELTAPGINGMTNPNATARNPTLN